MGDGEAVGVGAGLSESTLTNILLHVTLTPVVSLLLARKFPPAMFIVVLPEPARRKVKVASTPEESIEVSCSLIPSLKPPLIVPIILTKLNHKFFELPTNVVGSPPLLSERKDPC